MPPLVAFEPKGVPKKGHHCSTIPGSVASGDPHRSALKREGEQKAQPILTR